MKQTSINTILFNVAGLGLLLFLGGYMVNSALRTETSPTCTARFGDGQQFALQNSEGAALSPIELQARVPTREWGLLDSARVVTDNDATFLQVALGPQEGSQPSEPDPDAEAPDSQHDGVGFVWQPQNLTSARSGCLSYRVYLSKDFAFDQRGTLPALYATKEPSDLDVTQIESGFISRLGWDKGGVAGLSLKMPFTPGTWLSTRNLIWPVNRWVSVEQEIVLNTPQKSDGLVRVWIDGALKIEKTGLNLGAKEDLFLSGVVADVGFNGASSKSSRITLSPFVVQGQ